MTTSTISYIGSVWRNCEEKKESWCHIVLIKLLETTSTMMLSLVYIENTSGREAFSTQITVKFSPFVFHHVFFQPKLHGKSFLTDLTEEFILSGVYLHVTCDALLGLKCLLTEWTGNLTK